MERRSADPQSQASALPQDMAVSSMAPDMKNWVQQVQNAHDIALADNVEDSDMTKSEYQLLIDRKG